MKREEFLIFCFMALAFIIFLPSKAESDIFGDGYVIKTTEKGAIQHWNRSQMPIVYEIDTTTAPPGALEAIQKAFQTWQNVEPAYIEFIGIETTSSRYDRGCTEIDPYDPEQCDGHNIISWGEMPIGHENAIAVTSQIYYSSTGQILDRDIRFNSAFIWAIDCKYFQFTPKTPKSKSYRDIFMPSLKSFFPWDISLDPSLFTLDIQSIATHEIGHFCGLGDVPKFWDIALTMYHQTFTLGSRGLCDTRKRTLEEGDIAGLNFIYDPSEAGDGDEDGYREDTGDCDDADPSISPSASEICDGLDNDCDEKIDEDFDQDGDGYTICEEPIPDCDDTKLDVNPGATEGPEGNPTCSDFLDNDCDGLIDGEDPECGLSMGLLPDTGITSCYNDTQEIPSPSPGEPFYGQDAQYMINPMNFTDNGDGTVTDNVTGLMWQQEDEDIPRTWYEAINYCEDLALASYMDWRLPDEYELQGIVDYGRYDPAIDTTYFPGVSFYSYWSLSTAAFAYGDVAWEVTFYTGYVHWGAKHDHGAVRCVRGEATTQSFTDNYDGTVTDNVTGLMWQQEDDGPRNWEGALAYCESLDPAGYSDWRLPDIKELRSIVYNTIYSPAIDTTYFPGTASYYYWSSSTTAFHYYQSWVVDFWTGEVFNQTKSNNMYVRCVR